jgi:ADP-heptose:LPS heptosyltransferase
MRYASVTLALARWGFRRRRPPSPQRILVLHHLLLGDTLMVTGLLAKLRECHPAAEIVMTANQAWAPLYASRPYGVAVHPFDPRDVRTFGKLFAGARFDLVILPADNRWSWTARALGARWIVAVAGDHPVHKNWPVDELLPYSPTPTAFGDTAAGLVSGPPPARFRTSDWPAPPASDVPTFGGHYAVLHVGASSPLKQWQARHWQELAAALEVRGLTVVWSAGPGEGHILDAIDRDSTRARIAGTLTLAQLWHVLAGARLLVCPDTGIAHLGRVVGVPTVTLFGPGSALICGPGSFFADMPGCAVTVDPFPCRDQTIQFFREVPWVRRCQRLYGDAPDRCARARCMEAIEVTAVLEAVDSFRIPVTAPA